jgi:iduronate 2-sulfatase
MGFYVFLKFRAMYRHEYVLSLGVEAMRYFLAISMKIFNRIIGVLLIACGSFVEMKADTRPNVLLICVDDLRPELNCFGKSYIHSPNIDRLASKGRVFLNHYVQAPTCGASRNTLLTGRYGSPGNDALFRRASRLKQSPDSIPPTLPTWFRQNGYTTVSVGKVSHHPGGFGGPDWNDPDQLEMPESWDRHLLPAGPWQHPRGWMHGLANGEIRVKAEDMDLFQAIEGSDAIYPDGTSVDEALHQMEELSSDHSEPFFLAVGILRPHLPFGAPAKYMQHYVDAELPPTPHPFKPAGKTTWHGSGEFMKYNRWGKNPNTDAKFAMEVRKHYAACVTYADAQVGRLLGQLEKSGAVENTIVILWGDHGWHLGEHAIWGKHALYEESLKSPLIVSYPKIQKPGVSTRSMVETLDLFPTLCDLAELPIPDFVDGVSLNPQLENPEAPGHSAIAYTARAQTIRQGSHRMILHKDGYIELYDHSSAEGETRNIAIGNETLIARLTMVLNKRLNQ